MGTVVGGTEGVGLSDSTAEDANEAIVVESTSKELKISEIWLETTRDGEGREVTCSTLAVDKIKTSVELRSTADTIGTNVDVRNLDESSSL